MSDKYTVSIQLHMPIGRDWQQHAILVIWKYTSRWIQPSSHDGMQTKSFFWKLQGLSVGLWSFLPYHFAIFEFDDSFLLVFFSLEFNLIKKKIIKSYFLLMFWRFSQIFQKRKIWTWNFKSNSKILAVNLFWLIVDFYVMEQTRLEYDQTVNQMS